MEKKIDDRKMSKEEIEQTEKFSRELAFQKVLKGVLSPKDFAKRFKGWAITVGGRRDKSKYSGAMLRRMREERALQALDNHEKGETPFGPKHYLDGTPIDVSRIVELW